MTDKLIRYSIHTDGGARGNPGPAAIGIVISVTDSLSGNRTSVLVRHGAFIGETTNNVAEYTAVKEALIQLQEIMKARDIQSQSTTTAVYLDSTLVVHQLNGTFKVKDPALRELLLAIRTLEQGIGSITYNHIPREKNREADQLVNQALDETLYH